MVTGEFLFHGTEGTKSGKWGKSARCPKFGTAG